MNGAQRAAFVELMRIGELMSNVCFFNLEQHALADMDRAEWECTRERLSSLQRSWDAARNRYFELEAEAAKAKSSARKSRGAVRQKGVTK